MMETKGSKNAPKYKNPQDRVLAMKGNLQKWFGAESWLRGGQEKNGWVRVGVKSDAIAVEAEEIQISEIPDDVETVDVDELEYPSREEMMDFVTEATGKKPHHALGEKKLKELYDENRK